MGDYGFAGDVYPYLYADTRVRVVDYRLEDYWAVFDMSDGTHWFEDNNTVSQVSRSLVGVDRIEYDGAWGWLVVEGDHVTSLWDLEVN